MDTMDYTKKIRLAEVHELLLDHGFELLWEGCYERYDHDLMHSITVDEEGYFYEADYLLSDREGWSRKRGIEDIEPFLEGLG